MDATRKGAGRWSETKSTWLGATWWYRTLASCGLFESCLKDTEYYCTADGRNRGESMWSEGSRSDCFLWSTLVRFHEVIRTDGPWKFSEAPRDLGRLVFRWAARAYPTLLSVETCWLVTSAGGCLKRGGSRLLLAPFHASVMSCLQAPLLDWGLIFSSLFPSRVATIGF